MRIRPLLESDLAVISAVCVDSFMATVAPGLSAQGVATFLGVASAEAFGARMKEDNAILVAEEEGRPVGVIELKEGACGDVLRCTGASAQGHRQGVAGSGVAADAW